MAPQHEHGLAALLVELLEEQQRLFLEAEAALLVAVNDVQRVLAPVVVDIVAFEGLVGGVVSGAVLQVLEEEGGRDVLTTGSTTSQGSLMATRKDLKISTCGLSLRLLSACGTILTLGNISHTDPFRALPLPHAGWAWAPAVSLCPSPRALATSGRSQLRAMLTAG